MEGVKERRAILLASAQFGCQLAAYGIISLLWNHTSLTAFLGVRIFRVFMVFMGQICQYFHELLEKSSCSFIAALLFITNDH